MKYTIVTEQMCEAHKFPLYYLKQHVLDVDEGGDLVGLVEHDRVLVLAALVHAVGGPGQGEEDGD